jgi:hypothetical protein
MHKKCSEKSVFLKNNINGMDIKTGSLTNLQLELLKVFSYKLPEEELEAVKRLLASHFAKRMKDEASKDWMVKGYTQDDMDKWLEDDTQ